MVKEFKIKFEEIEKLKKIRPKKYKDMADLCYIRRKLDLCFFYEPISIEIDGVIINACTDEFIKRKGFEYPYTLFTDYVTFFLENWLEKVPEILSGKPQKIMFWSSDWVLFHRIDEKNIKIKFDEYDRDFIAAGKDFIIPIDMVINEFIRASKEWIETRVVYCPKGEKDPDYIYIKELIEKAKQLYEQYKKQHNISD